MNRGDQRPARVRPGRVGGRARTASFRGFEAHSELRSRPPWWGRLEAHITIALVAIGILCVGASSYLVALTVGYYDQLGERQVEIQGEAIELAQPFYRELADAQREAFQARTELLPYRLAGLDDPASEELLDAWIAEHPAVLSVVVERPGREAMVVGRPDDLNPDPSAAPLPLGPEIDGQLRVPVTVPLPPEGRVQATWAVDPAIQARHQRLGELARDLGAVEVTDAGGQGRMAERDEVQRAVIAALGVASGLVLFIAILTGLVVARRATRKVSDLSAVMREVASGDLSVRAPRLGDDELGQLASAFNTMLDELEHTRRRIAYLQRIGAWQEMARRIAHEIKNPLTPIQLAVQQLREKDPGTDPRFSALLLDSAEIVEDEVESLRRMVTSFSQFAKLPEVELEAVELARVLAEFDRAYGNLGDGEVDGAGLVGVLGEEGLEVLEPDPDPQGEPLRVLGDRQLLKQVLVNLVENAALSAREAGVEEVHVRVSAGRVEGRPLGYFVVEDNGPGIAVDRRDLVFEPYETTRSQGTGLGLAIVKKIVLDHGGEVLVGESEELGGARLEVRVPLVDRGEG